VLMWTNYINPAQNYQLQINLATLINEANMHYIAQNLISFLIPLRTLTIRGWICKFQKNLSKGNDVPFEARSATRRFIEITLLIGTDF